MDSPFGLAPQFQLCTRCEALDLQEWFYPVSKFKMFTSPDVLWSLVVQNQQTCTFCALLAASLSLNLRIRSEFNAVHKLSFYIDKVGTVECQGTSDTGSPSFPGWQQDGTTTRRVVREVSVTAYRADGHSLGRIALLPTCTNQSFGPDRLLHCTQSPRSQVDLALLRLWIDTCQTHHSAACSQIPWSDMGSAQMRLIDVVDNCVITVSRPLEYFALSYCWGKPLQFRSPVLLMTTNAAKFSSPGYLLTIWPSLPLTIRHAIELTKILGRRYLWVDSLCILQDSASQRDGQINIMHTIYRHATVTIIAAAGIDAYHGLPGLEQGSRSFRSLRMDLGRFSLLSIHPYKDMHSAINSSEWSHRAWTLQEDKCSRRRLIFTEDEVIWCCNSETLSEIQAPESAFLCLGTTTSRHTRYKYGIGHETLPEKTPLTLFNSYMAAASSRKLGMETDRLRCVTGLLNDMERMLPGGFFWGFPVDFFDSALLFHAGIWDIAPYQCRPEFPSWSWTGPMTHARSSICGPYDYGFANEDVLDHPYADTDADWIKKAVVFHKIDTYRRSWHSLESALISGEVSETYWESRARWNADDLSDRLNQAEINVQRANSSIDHVLACWTQTVQLEVDRSDSTSGEFRGVKTGFRTRARAYTIRGTDHRDLGYIRLSEAYRQSQPDKLQFILIAEHKRWEAELGVIKAILLVEEQNGLTSRVDIVRDSMITGQRWQTLAPEWKFITMV